jgi:hypothetical protein
MISRLGRWLCPAFFGPVLAIWAWVTVSVFVLGKWEPELGKWGTWLVAMLFGTLFGGGLGVVLVLVDALLLRYRSRLLPMGPRAWLMGALAPFAVIGVWSLVRPGRCDGWLLGLAVVGPMLLVALVLRLVFSPRFGSK